MQRATSLHYENRATHCNCCGLMLLQTYSSEYGRKQLQHANHPGSHVCGQAVQRRHGSGRGRGRAGKARLGPQREASPSLRAHARARRWTPAGSAMARSTSPTERGQSEPSATCHGDGASFGAWLIELALPFFIRRARVFFLACRCPCTGLGPGRELAPRGTCVSERVDLRYSSRPLGSVFGDCHMLGAQPRALPLLENPSRSAKLASLRARLQPTRRNTPFLRAGARKPARRVLPLEQRHAVRRAAALQPLVESRKQGLDKRR